MTVEDLRLTIGGVWLVAFGAVFLSNVVGNLLGRRRRGSGLDAAQLGTVQGGLLGLLGLLLAFSFATAAGRFADRQELTLQEANAIGTAYLRADLLPSPQAETLRTALKAYVTVRVAFYDAGSDAGAVQAAIARGEQLHKTMWSAGVSGVRETPASTTVVVAALNDVIDLHAARVDALNRHLPAAVVLLVAADCSAGLGQRRRQHRPGWRPARIGQHRVCSGDRGGPVVDARSGFPTGWLRASRATADAGVAAEPRGVGAGRAEPA